MSKAPKKAPLSAASKAIRAAAIALLDLDMDATVEFYRTSEHQPCSINASMAIGDVVAVHGAHVGWNQPARFYMRDVHKDQDPRVYAILKKLADELDTIRAKEEAEANESFRRSIAALYRAQESKRS